MIALFAAAALAAGSCDGGLCNGGALQPFLAKLERRPAGGAAGRPLHILQIGDSHTAGDAITGAWREALQARGGGGGRGVLPPGRPYDGYTTRGVAVTMSPGWSIAGYFGKSWSDVHPAIGLAGFSLTASAEAASMTLAAEPQEAFDRLVVCAIARPGGGDLVLTAGETIERIDLGSVTERPLCHTTRLPAKATVATLRSEGGPVTITSWASFDDAGAGVALSNLGIVGSQLVHFARTDDAVLAEELRAYRPDLIVLAFGTNEGFASRFSSFEYDIILRTQIGRLRRLAGNVPILILGAPDALTRRGDLVANAGGAASPACGAPAIAAVPPAPTTGLAAAMARLGYALGFGDPPATPPAETAPPAPPPPPSPPPATRSSLFPPAALADVREVQKRVALALNAAFWDWEARMGGRCTADAWVHASPPLMRGDYVHYTSAGGREIAQRLQADLDQAAAR